MWMCKYRQCIYIYFSLCALVCERWKQPCKDEMQMRKQKGDSICSCIYIYNCVFKIVVRGFLTTENKQIEIGFLSLSWLGFRREMDFRREIENWNGFSGERERERVHSINYSAIVRVFSLSIKEEEFSLLISLLSLLPFPFFFLFRGLIIELNSFFFYFVKFTH